ncbi:MULTISPECIES: hypothetical protein [Enterococcus]|uniref:hypothetical protein n=1 Tax=Enterococcus TaxID=1350 RepID=UPI00076F97B9|nr:hypothetical protein [Enterococcus faecium]KXH12897.1 hypothetical protein AS274_07015 [Enterococcus faecium]MBE8746824.1 hypothetical protein [Enterococcus faecium]MDW7849318.1 hypothetical protein [Enterococcus faecium]
MNRDQYSHKETKYVWENILILAGIVLGTILLAYFIVIPNLFTFINWFVPNFWSIFGYIIILWIAYKILSFIWFPVYSILGKWSYLILLATLIYIFMQIA